MFSSYLNGDLMGTIKKYIDDGEKLCDLARSQVEQALKDLLPDPPGMNYIYVKG